MSDSYYAYVGCRTTKERKARGFTKVFLSGII